MLQQGVRMGTSIRLSGENLKSDEGSSVSKKLWILMEEN